MLWLTYAKTFMLFWQVYPKIQPEPLAIATGVYMVVRRRYYENVFKIFLFCIQKPPLLILSTVFLLIFTEIGLGQGQSPLSFKRNKITFMNNLFLISCQYYVYVFVCYLNAVHLFEHLVNTVRHLCLPNETSQCI